MGRLTPQQANKNLVEDPPSSSPGLNQRKRSLSPDGNSPAGPTTPDGSDARRAQDTPGTSKHDNKDTKPKAQIVVKAEGDDFGDVIEVRMPDTAAIVEKHEGKEATLAPLSPTKQTPRKPRGKKAVPSTPGTPGTPTTTITTTPSEPTRRSNRNRAPPKNPYMEGLVAEEAARKAKPKSRSTGGGGRKKKMTEEEKWAPGNLVTRSSPYIGADLTRILNPTVISRENMMEEDYNSIIALLPAEDIIYPASSDVTQPEGKPTIDPALFDSVFFKEAIRNYQGDLAAGKYEPEYIAKGEEARRRRMAGKFDAWKDRQFELHWGDKQRLFSDAIAGQSSKVKLMELVKTHNFKIGDVFSMRRPFSGGLMVRKDAVLIAVDLTEGTLSFSYPPGPAEWHRDGVPDKTIENVASLTALETLLCRESGSAPERLPNGNAFKTIRVIRKGEDIGCVFDIRNKYWHQYYGDIEAEGAD